MEAFDIGKFAAIAGAKAYDGKVPVTRDGVRKALSEIREFTGVSGKIVFDADGNATRQLFVKMIRNGKAEIIK
jgi:ABC-type branched-subunit amino acid transport system substrate-binding protein